MDKGEINRKIIGARLQRQSDIRLFGGERNFIFGRK